MKQKSTSFLKFVLELIALRASALMIWFPQPVGRATNLNLIHIYSDPFILYCYIATIPFFAALYHAFRLLGYIEKNKVFSPVAVQMLSNIKICALPTIGFLVGAILYIRFAAQGDDP